MLLVSAVFMYIATFMFTPTLPLFAREIGATDPSVGGLIILIYTVGSLVPRVMWGNLADRWERKPVFLIGIAIMATAAPFFGLFASLPGILIVRLIQGIGFSASSTSGSAMAADLVPASRLAEGIGLYTLANTVGMALGPDLGLIILGYGADQLFGAGLVMGVIGLGIGAFLYYEKKRRPSSSRLNSNRKITRDIAAPKAKLTLKPGKLFEKSVLTTSLVTFFAIMPYGAIMAYIASYGIDRGVGDIGLYFTAYALALFAVRLPIGRLSDRHGITAVMIPGIVLMICGLVVLYWATDLALFILSAVLFGFGFGVVFPLLQAVAYMFCPSGRRGAASATLFTTTDLAYGLGAVVLGFGIRCLGYAAAFAGLSIFAVTALVLYMVLLHPRVRPHHGREHDNTREGPSRLMPVDHRRL